MTCVDSEKKDKVKGKKRYRPEYIIPTIQTIEIGVSKRTNPDYS